MKRLGSSCYSVTASKIYTSNQLHLHSSHNIISKGESSSSLYFFKYDSASVDWFLIFHNIKTVKLCQRFQVELNLTYYLMSSTLFKIQHLYYNLHVLVVITKFSLTYIKWFEPRISGIIYYLALVDQEVLAFSFLYHADERTSSSKEVKDCIIWQMESLDRH